jgi:class 3 adenylate cyclase
LRRLPDAQSPCEHQRFALRNIALKSAPMPLYMDIHNLPEGTTAEDVAKAHAKDMETQRKYGVEYSKYWVNEKTGKVFCLVHAPNAEAAECVHREAHGMVAEKLIEIQPELAEGFLGGVETNAAGAVILPGGGADARDPGIRTVLFTDVVNSTTLTQSLGDEAALAILGVHDTIVRDALSALGGREVKHTGDGIMASFISPAGAVRCAIQIQRELANHAKANPERSLKVRVGAAAGEPVEQRNDLFGSTVQLAARLCTHAQPEQILVSNAIAELCLGKGLQFEDLGEVTLKGFGYPVRAQAAAWKQ